MELLSRNSLGSQIIEESRDLWLYMADRNGTLWENVSPRASLNHGFASHAVHTLYRDVLGLHRVDPVRKKLSLRFTDSELSWCEGQVPVNSGEIFLRWTKHGEELRYQLKVPEGYSVNLDNRSRYKLSQR